MKDMPDKQPLMGSPPTRKGWTIRRCSSFEDMRVQGLRNWQRVSATARTKAAWELVVDAWAMKQWNPDELRLHRVITVLRKA